MTVKLWVSVAAVAVSAAGSAAAADLPSIAAIVAPPRSAPIWTGLYLGGQSGYAIGENPLDESEFAPYLAMGYRIDVDDRMHGLEAGLFAGGDVQFGRLVLGAVLDVNYIDIDVVVTATSPLGTVDFEGTDGLEWHGSLRGRAGYAFGGIMPYLHGGLAFGSYRVENVGPILPYDESQTRLGIGVGVGAEALVGDQVSLKFEYQYTDLGTTDFALSDGVGGTLPESSVAFSSLRIGSAFRF